MAQQPAYHTDFLDKPLTPFGAYFAGYFCADGNISSCKSPRASICSVDEQILTDIAKAIDYPLPLKSSIRTRASGVCEGKTHRPIFQIGFAYRPRDRLLELGYGPRKTGREHIPEEITDDLFPRFLRGLSDGDGSLSLVKRKGKSDRLTWQLVGPSEKFLREILDRLIRLDVIQTKAKVYDRKTSWVIVLHDKSARAVAEFMYRDGGICIQRKKDAWLSAPPPRSDTWTPEELDMVKRGQCPPGRSRGAFYVKRHRMRNQ